MKKRSKLAVIVLVIAVLVIVIAIGYLVVKSNGITKDRNNYEKLATTSGYIASSDNTMSTVGETQALTSPVIDEKLAENPIDFKSLSETNNEIYSWIYIPDTNVNYPVLQSMSEDNFYLDHDIYRNYSFSGAIYSQVCNKTDYSDRVTVLYGHNMANHTMFADLHKFEDESFFNNHDKMYVYTPERKLTYKIVSAFVYDDRHIMNAFDFTDDNDFMEYLNVVQNPRSVYKNSRSDVDLDLDSKILTLSTCLDSGEGRYLLQGVLIKDEKTV